MSEVKFPLEFKLSKPIKKSTKDGVEEVHSFTLQEPLAGVMLELGSLQELTYIERGSEKSNRMRDRPEVITAYLKSMTGESETTLRQMAARDLLQLTGILKESLLPLES